MYWGRGTKSECAGLQNFGHAERREEGNIEWHGNIPRERQRCMFKFKNEFNFRLKKKKKLYLRVAAAIKPK